MNKNLSKISFRQRKKYPIAMIGAFTTIGQAVLLSLEERGILPEQIYILDAHQNAGKRVLYAGCEINVTPLDLFDFSKPYIAFLCTKSILSEYKEEAVKQGCWLIDCMGIAHQAPLIIPELNADQIKNATNNILENPINLAIILAQILGPLHRKFQIISTEVVALIGAAEFGKEALKSLQDQTRSLYTREEVPDGFFFKSQAFNLIPEIRPAIAQQTIKQLKSLLGLSVFVTTCLTPVFRGECLFLSIQLKKTVNLDQLISFFECQTGCRVGVFPNERNITSQDVIGDPHSYMTHIQMDVEQANKFYMWVVCDSIQNGAALNAVKIAEYLMQ